MAAPTFKKATDTDAGDSTKYGAPDVKYAFDVLDASHATDRIQASSIETTGSSDVQTDLDLKATLISPILTTPQINDTSSDHQYIFAVSELVADRTVTMPLLAANDTFVFEAFTQTLTNKTIVAANNTITMASTDLSDTANIAYLDAVLNAFTGIMTVGGLISGSANIAMGAGSTFLAGAVGVLVDSPAGTMTLSNIDALDATTEATIEAAIDTLANLTSAAALATVGTITTGVWSGTAIEGTAIASTGEAGGTKFLREDGDGTCSWQVPAGAGDMVLADVQTVTGAKTFADDALLIQNPAATFAYTIQGAAIAAARTLNLPLLTGNDTIVTEAFTQTLTNKSIVATQLTGTIDDVRLSGNIPRIDGTNSFSGSNEFTSSLNCPAGMVATLAAGTPLTSIHTDSATDTSVEALHLQHQSNGDMTTGFGSHIAFYIDDSGVGDTEIVQIQGLRAGNDTSGQLVIRLKDSGVFGDVLAIASNGEIDFKTAAINFGGNESLELPNSATPTVNTDGEIALDTTVTDFSHGVLKYYGGEEMAVIAVPITQLTTPTDGHLVAYNGTNDEFELVAGGGGGATDTEFPIPLVQELPEGIVGYPDMHDLATASAHVSGMVMPNGASVSTINLKTMHPIPDDLASTPAARIEFVIMTKGAVAGPADVRLTVSTLSVADTENFDQAFTAEAETTVTMPTATETKDVYSQDMTTDPAAGDTVLVKIARDPTDVADDFTDDIQIVSATLWIQRST